MPKYLKLEAKYHFLQQFDLDLLSEALKVVAGGISYSRPGGRRRQYRGTFTMGITCFIFRL